jgi:hypothetical protein
VRHALYGPGFVKGAESSHGGWVFCDFSFGAGLKRVQKHSLTMC